MKYLLVIGGCPRSGTTALAEYLNGDKRVFVSFEQNLLKLFSLFSIRERDRLFDATAGGVETGVTLRQIYEQLSPGPKLDMTSEPSPLDYLFSMKHVPKILKLAYRLHAKELGKEVKIFGDKYPLYFLYSDYLLSCPFKVKYIHITRNPYDVVNSMMLRTKNMADGKDPGWNIHFSAPRVMVGVWCMAFDSIRAIESRKDVLHIQYEDLVFRTAQTKARIDKFLGLEIQSDFQFLPAQFARNTITLKVSDQLAKNPVVADYARYLQESGLAPESLQNLPLLETEPEEMPSYYAATMPFLLHALAETGLFIQDNFSLHWHNALAAVDSAKAEAAHWQACYEERHRDLSDRTAELVSTRDTLRERTEALERLTNALRLALDAVHDTA